jgi:eukaryotic-like serine/threonine-protein kinase
VEAAFKRPSDASDRYLFTETPPSNPKTGADIWFLPLAGDRTPTPYVVMERTQNQARLSPDGRWLAYRSNDAAGDEVYVISFPIPDHRWKISTNGGLLPVWSHDGRELYYLAPGGKVMVAVIKPSKPGAQFQYEAPRVLFPLRGEISNAGFAVSKDGRFLLAERVEQDASTPMTVVLNWPEILKKK